MRRIRFFEELGPGIESMTSRWNPGCISGVYTEVSGMVNGCSLSNNLGDAMRLEFQLQHFILY